MKNALTVSGTSKLEGPVRSPPAEVPSGLADSKCNRGGYRAQRYW